MRKMVKISNKYHDVIAMELIEFLNYNFQQ